MPRQRSTRKRGTTHLTIIYLLLAVRPAPAAQAHPRRTLSPGVGVVVRNGSDAPGPIVQQAEDECERLFQLAGITIKWINASADIDWEGPERVLRAAILNQAPPSRSIDSFGSALPRKKDGLQLFVYYDRVTGLSRRAELPVHLILAGALTHEIGHMLLASSEHSVAGIMKGEWGLRDVQELGQGLLHFTPQQKRQMSLNMVPPAEGRSQPK